MNDGILESGLKAYRLRKNPRLNETMKMTRLAWVRNPIDCNSKQKEKVKMIYLAFQLLLKTHLTKILEQSFNKLKEVKILMSKGLENKV